MTAYSYPMHTLCRGKLAFVYASYKTRARAEEMLEDLFACGEVSECELAEPAIKCIDGRFAILLKAQ